MTVFVETDFLFSSWSVTSSTTSACSPLFWTSFRVATRTSLLVLKMVAHVEDGMTPFDAFHAATAETRGLPILSSDNAYEDVDPERLPLDPTADE